MHSSSETVSLLRCLSCRIKYLLGIPLGPGAPVHTD